MDSEYTIAVQAPCSFPPCAVRADTGSVPCLLGNPLERLPCYREGGAPAGCSRLGPIGHDAVVRHAADGAAGGIEKGAGGWTVVHRSAIHLLPGIQTPNLPGNHNVSKQTHPHASARYLPHVYQVCVRYTAGAFDRTPLHLFPHLTGVMPSHINAVHVIRPGRSIERPSTSLPTLNLALYTLNLTYILPPATETTPRTTPRVPAAPHGFLPPRPRRCAAR